MLGRWTPTSFEGWAGAIERKGPGTTRTVTLPEQLRGTDLEIYIYRVGASSAGSEPRAPRRRVRAVEARAPTGRSRVKPTECFVIAATRLL